MFTLKKKKTGTTIVFTRPTARDWYEHKKQLLLLFVFLVNLTKNYLLQEYFIFFLTSSLFPSYQLLSPHPTKNLQKIIDGVALSDGVRIKLYSFYLYFCVNIILIIGG